MAQVQANGPGFGATEGIAIGKMVNVTAGVLSLGLVIGIGVWGTRMVMRDVSGVPVIQAVTGEMRVRPTTPGGRPAAHQGLSVNTIAAVGEAGQVPDQLTLAPRPAELSDEDVATRKLPGTPVNTGAASGKDRLGNVTVAAAGMTTAPSAIDALAEQLAAGAVRLTPTPTPAPTPTPEATPTSATGGTADAAAPAVKPARPKHGLARSLRPQMRPKMIAAAVASATAKATKPDLASASSGATDGVANALAETIAPGTRLAQLGAYDSVATAEKEWTRLDGVFGDYMEGKTRVVQKASSGGRTFYRLRAMGFADISDARRFCAAFVAQKRECIPVVTK
ncbi:MAG: SPOR domain-containing protein [Pseudooceanicola sp.]